MGNAGLFREFKNYKMVAISCYTFPFSFISACAPVSLWRLAIALEQMLQRGRRPRVGLILYSGLQFFSFFSVSFTKSAGFVFLPGKASLISISGAVLLVRV